jgi:hypothetical protein
MSVAIVDDSCPISERLLFQIYDASKHKQPMPQLDLSGETKSMLALFCYRRSHLESAGLAIAATCDEEDLVEAGGLLGLTLFLKSRDVTSAPKDNSRDSIRALLISLAASQPTEAEGDEGESGP